MDHSILCEASNKPKTDGYKAVASADGSDWTSPTDKGTAGETVRVTLFDLSGRTISDKTFPTGFAALYESLSMYHKQPGISRLSHTAGQYPSGTKRSSSAKTQNGTGIIYNPGNVLEY